MKHEFYTPFVGRFLYLLMALALLFPFALLTFLFIDFGRNYAAGTFSGDDAFYGIIFCCLAVITGFAAIHHFRHALSTSPSLVIDQDGIRYRSIGASQIATAKWDQVTLVAPNRFLEGRYLTIFVKNNADVSGTGYFALKAAFKVLRFIFILPFRLFGFSKKTPDIKKIRIFRFTVNAPLSDIKHLIGEKLEAFHGSGQARRLQNSVEKSPHVFPVRDRGRTLGNAIATAAMVCVLVLPLASFGAGYNTFKVLNELNPAGRGTQILRERAEAGDADAQNKFGWRLSRGVGIPKSEKRAFPWYMLSAKQGFDKAQYNVGRAYRYGKGVSRDYKKAAEWYQKSANQNFAMAQSALGYLYLTGKGVELNYNKAIDLFERAAAQNDAKAFYQLGRMHEKGIVFEKSREKAISFYEKASAQFYQPATKALMRLREVSPPSPSS